MDLRKKTTTKTTTLFVFPVFSIIATACSLADAELSIPWLGTQGLGTFREGGFMESGHLKEFTIGNTR